MKISRNGIFSGNQLKIIAAIAMTVDHTGYILFPGHIFLRILGRLAFPIFAYMLSEGHRYTKNRTRHFLGIFISAAVFQIVYSFLTGSFIMNAFMTFSLSLIILSAIDETANRSRSSLSFLFLLLGVFVLCELLPLILPSFSIDYGFFGVLLPVWCYMGRTKREKLLFMTIGLLPLCISIGYIQWLSFSAVPFIALYNGKRGVMKLKWFFYIYYPLHMIIIYLLSCLV